MTCYECDTELVDDNWHYTLGDSEKICPKCYGDK